MQQELFQQCLRDQAKTIEQIKQAAHQLHESVNQRYAVFLPYGYHLDMVVNGVRQYGHVVLAEPSDVIAVIFAAYYHDSIEDARVTYNDVLKEARQYMDEQHAVMAVEIVYALTNDKGRTRSERAGEKYYQGIRETPYAPFVKLCDRLANVTYSCSIDSGRDGNRMREVYKHEMVGFLPAINSHSNDPRFQIPFEVIMALSEILIDEVDRDEVRKQWGELYKM
jgi:(p)ppGpp synthase/HD superfamily hydrolase